MKVFLIMLSLLAAHFAFANCSDNVVANCGNTKLGISCCPQFNDAGQHTGATCTYFADIKGPYFTKTVQLAANSSKPNLYGGVLNSDANIYATIVEKTGMPTSYSIYTSGWGITSPTIRCKNEEN